MINLKNVSKFYYSKGIIATGFSKVNLEFNIGEFVAITGESGSGKSTLLNVISGLDSYEEGEMYINGSETSHYLEKDWEIYRRKYIGNIYQNFNLINSYTVYQNIDLILSLNGTPKNIRKEKIKILLKRVGLTHYRNVKVSKLSGGQKQRVAIARALAKDVPIIIADEPTASLDKKTAIAIIQLLRQISKDKLIIIVTHNYEQVEKYVTRKITMHDGKVLEDKKIKLIENSNEYFEIPKLKNIKIFDKLKLAVRNTFNVITKFILLFLVYSFIVCALMGEYSYFRQNEYESSKSGYNMYFNDLSDNRIVLNKKDKTSFTTEELQNIKDMDNISYIIDKDSITDSSYNFVDSDENIWLYGTLNSKDNFSGNVDIGRLPETDDEIVISANKNDYYIQNDLNDILDKEFYLVSDLSETLKSYKVKIVGIKYSNTNAYNQDYKFYVSNSFLDKIQFMTHQKYSKVTINFMGTNYTSDSYSNSFKLEANDYVGEGKAYISENYNTYCDKEYCINKTFNINVENLYYQDNKTLTIEKTYNKNTISKILNLLDYEKEKFDEFYDGIIYINPNDYNNLFNKGTYQISVYVKDIKKLDETAKKLENNGYHTVKIRDTIVSEDSSTITRVIKIVVTTLLVAVLFFISYFIIKLILKSRNTYFSIIRMLGASKRVCRSLITTELFIVSNISYFTFILIAELNRRKIFSINFIDTINNYFTFNDYIILYIIIIVLSILISIRYSANLFKNSAMNTYREEA